MARFVVPDFPSKHLGVRRMERAGSILWWIAGQLRLQPLIIPVVATGACAAVFANFLRSYLGGSDDFGALFGWTWLAFFAMVTLTNALHTWSELRRHRRLRRSRQWNVAMREARAIAKVARATGADLRQAYY